MPAPAPRVLYLQFANPAAYPPIAHGAHILAEHGAEVHILGTRPPIAAEIELASHPRIHVTQIPEGTGIAQKLAFVRFLGLALWMAVRLRPDWLYVSDAFAAPAGLVAAALTGTPVVYHEHDAHTEPSPSILVRLCLAARRRLARLARLVVAPNHGRAAQLAGEVGIEHVAVVLNCPRRVDVREQQRAESGPLRLAYHGTIVPSRVPLALADAIGALRGAVRLRVAGYEPPGAAGHMQALIDRVAAAGAPGAIEYAGIVMPREALIDLCARADVGLALVPRHGGDFNMQTMAGASNKAFDYLACGVPLLVSDVADWREMFVSPGFAVATLPDEPFALVETLRSLAERPDERRSMGAAGRRRVLEEWNYEHQFAPVRDRLFAVPRLVARPMESAA